MNGIYSEYGDIIDCWKNIEGDGCGVKLTERTSTIINILNCTYINGKTLLLTSDIFTLLVDDTVDASKIKHITNLFTDVATTIGSVKTQADADKFNKSSCNPATLTFEKK